nr:bifunctional phosphoglucose/phosphomannose isomerase [Chloroflexota bacterium]
MFDLDAPQNFSVLDPQRMLNHIAGLPQQCEDAWDEIQDIVLPDTYRQVDQIVILGMGGSAIGGDLLRALLVEECPIPCIVHRDYGVPAFVNQRTLVIACSYSGDTEEALSGFDEALQRGARLLSITTGGELARRTRMHGLPLHLCHYKTQPRAAVGCALMALLGIVQHLGLVNDKSADVAEAITVMREWQAQIKETVPVTSNAAKALAEKLYGRVPVVYGAEHLSEVARRWKGQFNENAKTWAIFDVFPELCHNTVAGYPAPSYLLQYVHVVMLTSSLHHPRMQMRFDVVRELLQRDGFAFDVVEARGCSKLAQMLSLVLFGDYVSFYLAMLYQVDPWSIGNIDLVKKRLSGT